VDRDILTHSRQTESREVNRGADQLPLFLSPLPCPDCLPSPAFTADRNIAVKKSQNKLKSTHTLRGKCQP